MSGIYIHIPFCKQACYYCDFHFSASLRLKNELLKALSEELLMRKDEMKEVVETIYFGGGTPSILDVKEIRYLLEIIDQNYRVSKDPEITLEANPDDLTSEKIKEISLTGINRLSIGVQSFFDEDLKFMNRVHSAEEAINSVRGSLMYFKNITIDLIYGVPGMDEKKWKKNLQTAFDLKVPHISAYALTVENRTALAHFIKKGKYPPVEDELAQEHFSILTGESKKQGFVQYEISNFGKEGFFSIHNTSYWQGKPYLGIGPSAHSFKEDLRSWNISSNGKYIKAIEQKILPSESEKLSVKDQYNEMIMTGLRTIWGVSVKEVEKRFGREIAVHLQKNSEKYLKRYLMKQENDILTLTDEGKFLSDGIAADLFIVKD
jgi:oxygen-independent coproporphyrinogen-3 oxidase